MMGEVMTPLPPGAPQGRGKPVGGGHERENLRYIIQQWNANRLDLFEISEPDENLEFHGVMRFYFQDSGQKVATKCIRVGSSSTTKHVIATLVQKFRPDMRMLSAPSYLLYEIHENGEERRLADDEKPLLVQLNWNKDDREGRFLLRRVDFGSKVHLPSLESLTAPPSDTNGSTNFIRKLSRREKKDLKKQEKQRRAAEDEKNSVAEKLYTELPETSFTRSISNPEAVMRRRRAQKLEKKLQQFRSKDGGPDTGGTLKIYGSSLCPDVPYKTLLLSVTDTAQSVVKEMLEKYGLLRENPIHYCLIQAVVTAEEAREGYEGPVYPQKEYVLDDDECPLAILMNHSTATGSIMFHVRRRSVDQVGPRKRKKKPLKGTIETAADGVHQTLPLLVELGIEGNELTSGNHHRIQPNVTEVGSERAPHGNSSQILQLFGPDVHPRHCVLALTDGVVTVTPCNREAESSINGCRIYETTILRHGCIVRFGRQHAYRFVDPQADPRLSSQFTTGMQHPQQPHIATPQPTPVPTMPQPPQWGQEAPRFQATRDPILPAVIEFREECEDNFFRSITTALDPTHVQFKLAPTYVLYMAARFRASTHYRTDLAPLERAKRLTMMLSKVAHMLQSVVQSRPQDPVWLSFWLANSSELLHFLKHDRHISGYSVDAQDRLAELVQISFRSLVVSMQSEMEAALPLLLEDRNDSDEEEGCTAHVLSILTNTMALLRRCRVNAALTIQLFSQLFHFLSTWAFNRVVTSSYPNYCSRVWGHRLRLRLSRIEVWAEKQGLELAADCHLAKLSQAAILLTSPKSSTEDIASISSSCFKLNSLQLGAILEQYLPQGDESPIPYQLRDSVVAVAESTADGLAREDGKEVTLQEEYDLQLPFILPEDGYSCDIVRGVPSGLLEFMTPLQNSGLCRMNPQPSSSGFWTIYMHGHENSAAATPMGVRSPSVMSSRSVTRGEQQPEVQTLHLQKTSQGMGLSIVATRGLNQDQLGIYIKSVVPGGSADQDGRLQAGDQLISVDGRSLVGISQERAAEYMKRTGSTVVLEVAKQGAFYHGLATVLEQPSPTARPGGPHGLAPTPLFTLSTPNLLDCNFLLPPSTIYTPSGGKPLSSSLPDLQAPKIPTRRCDTPPTQTHWDEQNLFVDQHRGARSCTDIFASTKDCSSCQRKDNLRVTSSGSVGSLEVSHQSTTLQHLNITAHVGTHCPTCSCSAVTPIKSSLDKQLLIACAPLFEYQNYIGSCRNIPICLEHARSSEKCLTIGFESLIDSEKNPLIGPERNPLIGLEKHSPIGSERLPVIGCEAKCSTPSAPDAHIINSPPNSPHDDSHHLYNPPPIKRSLFPPGGSSSWYNKSSLFPSTTDPPHAVSSGGNGPHRYASERDLSGPKMVHHNQPHMMPPPQHYRPQGGMYPPQHMHRMQPAKSVPALNSEVPLSELGKSSSHEQAHDHQPQQLFMPPYGQQQQHQHNNRSRSTQNLSSDQAAHDDRHYQNVAFHHSPNAFPHPQSRPASALLHRGEGDRPDLYRPSSQRDLRPHEPKLVHLPEEGELPPTAPKPRPQVRGMDTQLYRDSPPPPPPPASTHPLLVGGTSPGSAPPNRQGGGQFNKNSAWEREEKERYDQRRREAARQWRDEQIRALEMQPERTPQESARLETLTLEREFELRARQANEDDEEDEGSEEEEQLKTSDVSNEVPSPPRPNLPRGGPGFMSPPVSNGSPMAPKFEENKVKRQDEIRRKQQELEAASEAELKILREAQRRQEEENIIRSSSRQHASQRLDTLVSPSKVEYSNGGHSVNGVRGYEPMLNNNNNPKPPERHSSFGVVNHNNRPEHLASPGSNSGKRVQFSENTQINTSYDYNANEGLSPTKQQFQSADAFITEAESMLNFSPSPIRNPTMNNTVDTPGVIGAQEVYRDPRVRRLQEKQALQAATSNKPPVPETLTFREKMKMFAAETGENNTPKDKMKISRAQRDID